MHIVPILTPVKSRMHLPVISRWCIHLIFVKRVFIIGERTTVPCFYLQNNDCFMRPKEGISEYIRLFYLFIFFGKHMWEELPEAYGSSWARDWIWAVAATYTAAAAIPDPPNPLHQAGDQTHTSTVTWAAAVGVLTHCTIAGSLEEFLIPMPSYVIEGRRNCDIPQTRGKKFQSNERLLWLIAAWSRKYQHQKFQNRCQCQKKILGENHQSPEARFHVEKHGYWRLWFEKQFRTFRLWTFKISYIFFLIKTHKGYMIAVTNWKSKAALSINSQ